MCADINKQIYRRLNLAIDDAIIAANVDAPFILMHAMERVIVQKRVEWVLCE